MSRARQVANFDPALFAADEISGDKVSGGTIGAGVIGASVTGGAGLTLAGPVGMIAAFGMAAAPTGWIICNGASVSRTVTYDALFAVIGTTWGSPDGSTFNLPNLQGAFLRGVGTSTAFTQDSTITLAGVQSDQLQGHGHQSAVLAGYNNIGSGSLKVISYTAADFSQWDAVGTLTTLGANGSPRSGTETRPNNIGVTFCIKY